MYVNFIQPLLIVSRTRSGMRNFLSPSFQLFFVLLEHCSQRQQRAYLEVPPICFYIWPVPSRTQCPLLLACRYSCFYNALSLNKINQLKQKRCETTPVLPPILTALTSSAQCQLVVLAFWVGWLRTLRGYSNSWVGTD